MNSRNPHFIILLLVAIVIISGCIQNYDITHTHPSSTSYSQNISLPSSPACSGIIWRYILKDAIPCMLSNEELSKIKPLAVQLKGKNIEDSIWNILNWEEEHITYDWQKARVIPHLVVYSNGTVRILSGANSTIQTPYETIKRGKGICTDYAILTAGLLLAMNYSSVYIFEINTTGLGHATAAYKINGWFFMLDQHLPPMDLGSYYLHWNGTIKNAAVYEIQKENSTVKVKLTGVLTGEDFMIQSYTLNKKDLEAIQSGIASLILENFENLVVDSSLVSLKEGKLPSDYREGRIWTYTFPEFADYYNPIFHEQFVRYMYEKMSSDPEIQADLENYSAFWLSAENENGAIRLTLYIGKKD